MQKLWMTLLLLSVSLVAIVAPVYVESYDSVAAKVTKTSTTLETGSTSAQGTTSTETAPYDFLLKVDPPSQKVQHLKNGRSRTATYSVSVRSLGGFRGEVDLTVKDLPGDSKAFFNPEEGVPKPAFASVLKIIVPPSTPAKAYNLTIIGSSGEVEHNATTTLIVEGEAAPPTTPPEPKELIVTVSTDEENYEKGDGVDISGYVKLSSGASVEGAAVSVNVLDQTGKAVNAAVKETDGVGRYSDEFSVAGDAIDGIYTVFATASLTGYNDSYATVSFTVGVSQLPSVRIVNATITTPSGTPSSEFHPGETVVVWAVVNNTGADLVDGNMWVEALDSDKSPITLVVVVVTVHTREQVKIGTHVILGVNAKLGTYTVRILVSNGPIMGGGKFLDSKEMLFLVTSETSITTTTTAQLTTQTTSSNATQTESASTTSTTTSTSTSTAQTTTETTSASITETTPSTSTGQSTTSTSATETTTETTSTRTTETT
jgi:hypothetical protein